MAMASSPTGAARAPMAAHSDSLYPEGRIPPGIDRVCGLAQMVVRASGVPAAQGAISRGGHQGAPCCAGGLSPGALHYD